MRDSLKALAQDLGVEERVVLLPAQCNISEFLSAFDCYVFPSLYEGLSLAALEAQFNGLPCVMSDGGIDGNEDSDNNSIYQSDGR